MEKIDYWLALTLMQGIGPKTILRCVDYFGDMAEIFTATRVALRAKGLSERQVASIKAPNWREVAKIREWAFSNNCVLLSIKDQGYPQLLKEIHNPPPVLYVLGNAALLSKPQLALVGSRNATPVGCETASMFAKALSRAGFVITSGLALGIDGASHRGALLAGKTIAVLGTGVGNIYPSVHRSLAEKIIACEGVIVSELPPLTRPLPQNFPARNRIISGLAYGVLVVEAAKKSGSLITAKFAVEQNREIFAIPGSIHSLQVKGCHELIKQGAKLVETVQDILTEVGGFAGEPVRASIESDSVAALVKDPLEKQVLQHVDCSLTTRDVLITRTGLTIDVVSSTLLALELSGWVKTVPGGYVRVPANKVGLTSDSNF